MTDYVFPDKPLVAVVYPCHCKAFDSCPYKETDDDLCEICISDAISHLNNMLLKLKLERRLLDESKEDAKIS